MAKILIIHGPNLNLLGAREPSVYGQKTLAEIDRDLLAHAERLGHQLQITQANAEHTIIDTVHNAKLQDIDFIIINAGAYTHTSIAIRDAFLATSIPFIEVHLSNIFAREQFRHHSYLSDIAKGVICGFYADSYHLALTAADHCLRDSN